MPQEIVYPIRLNRYLALNGIASRREADALIEKGLVFVNGKKAELGTKVNEKDEVIVNTKKQRQFKKLVYFAFNKPQGIITHSPQGQEKDIRWAARLPKDVFPVGRLDKDSHGLIILTNDGRITDRLLSPEYDHEKEYEVQVDKNITSHFLEKMRVGVELEDFTTRPADVEQLNKDTFSIILTEGKKHQIRRMCAALGYAVRDLKRVRILNIFLDNLGAGKMRPIEGEELEDFLDIIGLANS